MILSCIFLNIYLPWFLYSKLNSTQIKLPILITIWVEYLYNQCFLLAPRILLMPQVWSAMVVAAWVVPSSLVTSFPCLTSLTPLLIFSSSAMVDWLIVLMVPNFYLPYICTLSHTTLPFLSLKRQNVFLHLLHKGWIHVQAMRMYFPGFQLHVAWLTTDSNPYVIHSEIPCYIYMETMLPNVAPSQCPTILGKHRVFLMVTFSLKTPQRPCQNIFKLQEYLRHLHLTFPLSKGSDLNHPSSHSCPSVSRAFPLFFLKAVFHNQIIACLFSS